MFSSNPMEIIQSLGTVSIFVLLTLLVFSVTSWGIIVYKWRMFQAMDCDEEQFLENYERFHSHAKGLEILKNWTNADAESLSPSGAVFGGIVAKVNQRSDLFSNRYTIDRSREGRWPDRQYLEKVVQYIVQGQIAQQESYLSFLATTGTITPFIGLFGTVIGVMNSFREIGKQGSASIAAVAPGVAEALVATAAGLFAAIPAVVAYNYFLTRIRKSTQRMEAFSIEFLNTLDEIARDISEATVPEQQEPISTVAEPKAKPIVPSTKTQSTASPKGITSSQASQLVEGVPGSKSKKAQPVPRTQRKSLGDI